MYALKETIHLETNRLVIDLPAEFTGKNIEVIILDAENNAKNKIETLSSKQFSLSDFAGCWEGEPLTRAPQGKYETRDELR